MTIVLQDTFGTQYSLDIPLTIGSDSSNRLVLLDSSASPFHAEVLLKGDSLQVRDLDSDFGISVNGEKIIDTVSVYPGDSLLVGKVPFTVEEIASEALDADVPEVAGLSFNQYLSEAPVTVKVDSSLKSEPEPVVEIPIESPGETPAEPTGETESPDTIFIVQSPGYVEISDTAVPIIPPAGEIPESRLDFVLPAIEPDEPYEPVPPVEESTTTEKKPFNPKLALIIGGAVLLLAIVGGIIALVSSQGVSSNASSSSNGGPAELSLKDEALNSVFSTSFIQHHEDTYEGVDPTGAALKVRIIQDTMEQSTPEWSNYARYQLTSNKDILKDTEFSILRGQVYSRVKGACSVFEDTASADHKPTNWPKSFLKSYITGTARKVESGVKVNGVLTDKYALKLENSPFAGSLIKMESGELYRAQKGGYLVKLVITQTWPAEKWQGTSAYGFAGDQPVNITNVVDFTYYPDGKLNVIVPAVCASKIQ